MPSAVLLCPHWLAYMCHLLSYSLNTLNIAYCTYTSGWFYWSCYIALFSLACMYTLSQLLLVSMHHLNWYWLVHAILIVIGQYRPSLLLLAYIYDIYSDVVSATNEWQ